MSGIEAIGILASATQLATYSIKIVLHLDEVFAAFQNTSTQTRGHLKQVQELIQTTTLIEQYESLWSPAVLCQLQATLSEAKILHDLLRALTSKHSQNSFRKYWSILSGVAEKQILSGFENLERRKSTLCMCINTVHTDLLLSIRGSIDTHSRAGVKKACSMDKQRETLPKSALKSNTGPATMQQPSPSSNRTGFLNPDAQRTGSGTTLVPARSSGNDLMRSAEKSQGQTNNRFQTPMGGQSFTAAGHTYNDTTVQHGARQHAGDQNSENAQPATVAAAKNHNYRKSSADGQDTRQVLGNMTSEKAIELFYNQGKKD